MSIQCFKSKLLNKIVCLFSQITIIQYLHIYLPTIPTIFCFRYLSTGDSFQTIAFSFRVRRSTASKIVEEVCKAIWEVLQPISMLSVTDEKWKQSELGYRELWGFPNCVGSIDGKHVKIECSPNRGSNYFCYKSYFSIVLLAIVDPY